MHNAELAAVQLLREAALFVSSDSVSKDSADVQPEARARELAKRIVTLQREMHRLIDATPRADFVPFSSVLRSRYES